MNQEIAIISSRSDPASTNIALRLRELAEWETKTVEGGEYKVYHGYRLIFIDGELIHLRGIDQYLSSLGISPDLIVFASRHKAKEGIPWLGGHFTGIIDDDGSFEISTASPAGLKAYLSSIASVAPSGFGLSAEATHHGPTDIIIPSFFAEIGSSILEWSDPVAGNAAAKAILSLENAISRDGRLRSDVSSQPAILGFGGGHYVQRQTELILGTGAAFGHMFSKYQAGVLSEELVEEAAVKSGAMFGYIDKKSFRSAERDRIKRILEAAGLELLGSNEIRELYPENYIKNTINR